MKRERLIAFCMMICLMVSLPVMNSFAEDTGLLAEQAGTEEVSHEGETVDGADETVPEFPADLEDGAVADVSAELKGDASIDENTDKASIKDRLASEALFPWICLLLGLAILAGVSLALFIRLSGKIKDERQRFQTFSKQQESHTVRCD